jgi:hypothetical protein
MAAAAFDFTGEVAIVTGAGSRMYGRFNMIYRLLCTSILTSTSRDWEWTCDCYLTRQTRR